jgi:hypothetical protein
MDSHVGRTDIRRLCSRQRFAAWLVVIDTGMNGPLCQKGKSPFKLVHPSPATSAFFSPSPKRSTELSLVHPPHHPQTQPQNVQWIFRAPMNLMRASVPCPAHRSNPIFWTHLRRATCTLSYFPACVRLGIWSRWSRSSRVC